MTKRQTKAQNETKQEPEQVSVELIKMQDQNGIELDAHPSMVEKYLEFGCVVIDPKPEA